MKKIKLISVSGGKEMNAGPKAPNDIIKILGKKSFVKQITLSKYDNTDEQILFRIIQELLMSRLQREVIVLQYPIQISDYENHIKYMKPISILLNSKNCVLLIHDLDSLRKNIVKNTINEIKYISRVPNVIVHNDKMEQYLRKMGVKSKITHLEIFDYLCEDIASKSNYKFDRNNLSIAYAGHFIKDKTPFIYELEEEKMDFVINLYGEGILGKKNSKMIYKGKEKPEKLPSILEGDLGLVWDGSYNDDDENKGFKYYTRFNSPHKLSCYLAAEMPVIVWGKSAAADFVRKYDVGYTISNLYDINNLDFAEYLTKKTNAIKVGKLLNQGYFTQKAIKKAIKNRKVR